jgi:hypothetical protein
MRSTGVGQRGVGRVVAWQFEQEGITLNGDNLDFDEVFLVAAWQVQMTW